ncbi:MAG TPA: hypothetical protein VFT16_05005 [Candidatus Saccharimonadales bacterium]|nr:hypothetical protein [Candidatus Saccharimonadales bacterium]
MAKRIVLFVSALAVGLAAYVGVARYQASKNTPEAAMASFMEDLAAGEAIKTYERFSDRYAAQYKQSAWQEFVRSVQGLQSPVLSSQAAIRDQFNTYAGYSNPQRFTYATQVEGRQFWVSAVILKQDKTWKIDDFRGSYE